MNQPTSAADPIELGSRSLKIFLSYSRRDEEFARELFAGLELCGFDPFIDKEDIAAGEDWELRLSRLIETADTVVFVVSPNSVSSDRCGWEVQRSADLNKRILPVVWRRVEEASTPERLKRLNYIFFDAPHSFAPSLGKLAIALRTDLEWLREHTRLGERAAEWDLHQRSEERLLRGEALAQAIAWHGSRPANAPEPTDLHRSFLAASEDAESARLGLQQRQLKEIAEAQAAKERALKETAGALEGARHAQAAVARTQKRNARLLAGVTALVLAIFYGGMRQHYISSEREARVFLSLVTSSIDQHRFDAAARYALQGLPPRGSLPFLSHSSPELEAKLAGAAQMSRLVAELSGHTDSIRSVTFDGQGKRIATASRDGFAQVWSLDRLSALPQRLEHEESVNFVAFSQDGTALLTASADGKARLWDLTTLKPRYVLDHTENAADGADTSVQRAVFSLDGTMILTVSQDRTARLWDAGTGRHLKTFGGHGGWVMSGEFSANGKLVVTASADGGARVWSTANDENIEPLAVLKATDGRLDGASFNRDATLVLTYSTDKTARLWDWLAAREVIPTITHAGGVFHATFSPDERRIATAAYDGTARITDAKTGVRVGEDISHDDTGTIVYFGIFSKNGRRLITTAGDGDVRLFEIIGERFSLHRLSARLRGHRLGVNVADLSPDGRLLVTASADGSTRVWSLDGAEIQSMIGVDFALTPDQGSTVALQDDGRVTVSDATTGEVRSRSSGPASPRPATVQISADGREALTAHLDRRVRLWEVETGVVVSEFLGHGREPVTSVAFYGDDRVLTTSEDRTARLWHRNGKQPPQIYESRDGPVTMACGVPWHDIVVVMVRGGPSVLWRPAANQHSSPFPPSRSCSLSPDGTRLLMALEDSSLQQWELPSLKALPPLPPSDSDLMSMTFDGSGRRVVVGYNDGRGRILSVHDGSVITTLVGHEGAVMNAMFSLDGDRVVTASSDETIRIWDTSSGTEIARLHGRGTMRKATFAMSDTRILSVSEGGDLQLWNVEWATRVTGASLRERVCNEKLVGAAQFTDDELKNPILKYVDAEPCRRAGILAADYWKGISHSFAPKQNRKSAGLSK